MGLGDIPGIAHGPVLASWKAEAGKAILKFSSVGSGLAVKDVELSGHMVNADRLQGFELAGEDRRFFRASAELLGNDSVVVNAAEVPRPVAVRYAWAAFPLCNLFNQEGFAAYPFRTDDWPFPTPAAVGSR
jgi:sialate O-acetylesterase